MKTLLTRSIVTLSLLATAAQAENEYENAPIHYSDTTPNDAAQRLERLMAAGKVKIDRTDAWSMLQGLLKEFGIPPESQVMVFSKTHCPYCAKAQAALGSMLKAEQFTVLEVRNPASQTPPPF